MVCHFLCGNDDSSCGAIHVETSASAASTRSAVIEIYYCMSQFSGKSVTSVYQLSVGDYTGSNAGAECNLDEILHSLGCSIVHFAQSGCLGVVCYGNGNSQTVGEHLGQWHHTLGPSDVGGVFDGSVVIVAARCSDAHSPDIAKASGNDCHLVDCCNGGIHELPVVFKVLGCNSSGCLYIVLFVNQSEHGVRSAEVKTDYEGLILHIAYV